MSCFFVLLLLTIIFFRYDVLLFNSRWLFLFIYLWGRGLLNELIVEENIVFVLWVLFLFFVLLINKNKNKKNNNISVKKISLFSTSKQTKKNEK